MIESLEQANKDCKCQDFYSRINLLTVYKFQDNITQTYRQNIVPVEKPMTLTNKRN